MLIEIFIFLKIHSSNICRSLRFIRNRRKSNKKKRKKEENMKGKIENAGMMNLKKEKKI